MEKTHSVGSVGPRPDDVKLHKLMVNLGNAYVRLAERDRRKVMRLLDQITFGKGSSGSYWERWSKDDMQAWYLKLKPISPKMANDLRLFASVLLKTGRNDKLALRWLVDELDPDVDGGTIVRL